MNSKGLFESKRSRRRRTTGLGLGLQERLEEETMSWEGEVVRQGIVKGIYREYTKNIQHNRHRQILSLETWE
jgi:hypothetical protein